MPSANSFDLDKCNSLLCGKGLTSQKNVQTSENIKQLIMYSQPTSQGSAVIVNCFKTYRWAIKAIIGIWLFRK